MSLKERLARLEARLGPKRVGFPVVVLIGVFDCDDADVMGCGIGGRKVFRKDGETLDELKWRASRELNMQFLFAVYVDGRFSEAN
jgi:hypothetical protein